MCIQFFPDWGKGSLNSFVFGPITFENHSFTTLPLGTQLDFSEHLNYISQQQKNPGVFDAGHAHPSFNPPPGGGGVYLRAIVWLCDRVFAREKITCTVAIQRTQKDDKKIALGVEHTKIHNL